VNLHHFSGSLATCVVLAGGDIVLVQEDGSKSNDAHIEIVGSVDAGITAARWSPDEELLCITTDADTVVLMSRSFDGIGEATIRAEDLNLSKHVSVGWGKKETQFRGKGAKALRDPTIPEKVDEGLPSQFEYGRTAISWRGDGAYFAVNSLQKGSRRAIRVYTRDAVLESVSEPVDGLEGTVSWRPAGNLIAGIQRWNGMTRVVFFERNGLRHGDFTLRMPRIGNADGPQQHGISLEWNTDSTVLAALYRGVAQLWTMGNYHWYLKQTVPIFQDGVQLAWHPEKALTFTTASSLPTRSDPTAPANQSRHLTSDCVACYEFIFTVARGSVLPPHDMGAVAVVDGPAVRLTPFKQANVPPPMALYELDTDADVIDVAFDEHNEQLAVLHQGDVCLYKWPSVSDRLQPPARYASRDLDSNGIQGRTVLQVCFLGSQLLAVLSLEDTKGVVSLYHVDSQSSKVIHHRDEAVVPGLLNIGTVMGADNELFGQGMARGFLRGLAEEPLPVLRLQQQLPWLEARWSPEDLSIVPVGLAKNGNLYAGLRLLAKNCTSFLLTADHVIYTTTASLLKFVHVQTVAGKLLVQHNHELEKSHEADRRARNGSTT
jgi:elongator complex protein 1